MCICLTLQTLIATYLLACESEASICSEALRVWPHFLEKTFGLKHSFCNFLLFFFLPKWLILTGVVWLFMSVHQTELNSVWQAHLKGKKEKRGKKPQTQWDPVCLEARTVMSRNTTDTLIIIALLPAMNASGGCLDSFARISTSVSLSLPGKLWL